MTSITFLGTAGGRFATIYQIRSTGGIYVEDEKRIHIDPGPGAVIGLKHCSIDPADTDALLVSHCHPDHYSDAEVLVEGMARGGFRNRGFLAGSESVINGAGKFGPAISSYHRSIPETVRALNEGEQIHLDGLEILATPTKHRDPTGVGFKIHTAEGVISLVGDTELTDAVVESHLDARVLILNVTRPIDARISHHLSTEDALEFVRTVEPEMTIFTHFGMRMLQGSPEGQAEFVQEGSGVRTLAARDFIKLNVGKKLEVDDIEANRNCADQ